MRFQLQFAVGVLAVSGVLVALAKQSFAQMSTLAVLQKPVAPTAFAPWPLPVKAGEEHDVSYADCIYTDPAGRKWFAPKSTITDGASIPTICLSFIGDRRDIRWRGAALVHDAYCAKANANRGPWRQATWESVHRMFYDACLAGHTPPEKAFAMYSAVWLFNRPRWEYVDRNSPQFRTAVNRVVSTMSMETASNKALVEARASSMVMAAQRAEIQRLDIARVDTTLKVRQFREVVDYVETQPLTLAKLDSVLVAASLRLKIGKVLELPGTVKRD